MIYIDAVGDDCPIPVIKVKRAIRESEPNATVHIVVDNEIATQNLQKMASELGLGYLCKQEEPTRFEVFLTKGDGAAEPAAASRNVKAQKSSLGVVVVVSSDVMGRGDDELGASLLKAFIFTLAELDELPDAVLFYNAGVRLTTEGSGAIEDLERLIKSGCSILSCGACLNYYGLDNKLRVGEVTNMLKIVEMQCAAARVIKP